MRSCINKREDCMHTGRGIINHEVNYARKRIANCEQPEEKYEIFSTSRGEGWIFAYSQKSTVIMIFDIFDVDMCDMMMIKIFSNLKCLGGWNAICNNFSSDNPFLSFFEVRCEWDCITSTMICVCVSQVAGLIFKQRLFSHFNIVALFFHFVIPIARQHCRVPLAAIFYFMREIFLLLRQCKWGCCH